MRKRGVLPREIMKRLGVKYWQVIDANKKYRAKFESQLNRKFIVKFNTVKEDVKHKKLTGISTPLYTPYGTALTIGDVIK